MTDDSTVNIVKNINIDIIIIIIIIINFLKPSVVQIPRVKS